MFWWFLWFGKLIRDVIISVKSSKPGHPWSVGVKESMYRGHLARAQMQTCVGGNKSKNRLGIADINFLGIKPVRLGICETVGSMFGS